MSVYFWLFHRLFNLLGTGHPHAQGNGMGALIPVLGTLLKPAISSFASGLTSHKPNNPTKLDAYIAQQAGAGSTASAGLPSELGQLFGTLQKLQRTSATTYQQVTGQIANNLQKAALKAATDGNVKASDFLNHLATDFSNASVSGQLPSSQKLSQAVGGVVNHQPGSNNSGQSLDQLLASLQNGQSQITSYNPLSIINSTLSAAGVTSF